MPRQVQVSAGSAYKQVTPNGSVPRAGAAATEKQKAFLKKLGATPQELDGLSAKDASRMIDARVKGKSSNGERPQSRPAKQPKPDETPQTTVITVDGRRYAFHAGAFYPIVESGE